MKQEFDAEMKREFDAEIDREIDAEIEREFEEIIAQMEFDAEMEPARAAYARQEEFETKVRDERLRQTALKRKRSENFWNGFGGDFVTTASIVVIYYLFG